MIIFVMVLGFLLYRTLPTFASSSYVLPYPSTMPGGINYQLHVAWGKISRYWYFGNFGQFAYHLKESDKYLVEAKTLFEYQQYLLGYKALQKSNDYFLQTLPHLEKAKREEKDITQKHSMLHEASLKHSEILQKMQDETPAVFNWSPEKNPSSLLTIHQLIQKSLKEREKYL